jgi:hypothetical protein
MNIGEASGSEAWSSDTCTGNATEVFEFKTFKYVRFTRWNVVTMSSNAIRRHFFSLFFLDYRHRRYHGTLKEVFRMASVRPKSSDESDGPSVVKMCGLFVISLSMFAMS